MNGHMDTDANGVRMPRIEMRKLEDDYAEFVLENTDASMANALRRIMIAEVRVLVQTFDIMGTADIQMAL